SPSSVTLAAKPAMTIPRLSRDFHHGLLGGFTGGRRAEFNTAGGNFAGHLSLPNGLPRGAAVSIDGFLTDDASVDFHGNELAGSLSLHGGSAERSRISIGPVTPTGQVFLLDSTYSGTATFSNIQFPGVIWINVATLDGSIKVLGDWSGFLEFAYSIFGPAGFIAIDGNLSDTGGLYFDMQSDEISGDILIAQNCNGSVGVFGNMAGEILVGGTNNGSITVNGDITGALAVTGVHNGELCAENLSAAQPLPSNIEIGCGIGATGTICGQSPVCPGGPIYGVVPASGTRDARQPHPENDNSLGARQGLGSPNPDAREEDKIKVTLYNSGLRAISHTCWPLCETGIEPVETGTLSPNKISCIRESVVGGNQYQIILDRPISAGHWTTIRYVGAGQHFSYASLPADANGDWTAEPGDITDFIDCCLNHLCPPFLSSVYRCDIDHNGTVNDTDQSVLENLLNGAGTFIEWNGKTLPTNTCSGGGGGGPPLCTDPESCGGGIEPQAMVSGGGIEGDAATIDSAGVESGGAADENAQFADWFVNYLTTANPTDGAAAEEFRRIVDSRAQWCVDHFTTAERAALAARLSDPSLDFASEAGRLEAATVVAALGS
ncbi:MAG: hypothetical protein Q7R41_18885, partial [Phycisphaerales bacterium]|nr:hypothetical protein [Phycisphaerales bacterium]